VALRRLTPQLAASPELRDSLTREARIRARALWTVDLHRVSMSHMALGGQGRLFVGGSSLQARILCLAD